MHAMQQCRENLRINTETAGSTPKRIAGGNCAGFLKKACSQRSEEKLAETQKRKTEGNVVSYANTLETFRPN
jgi:hypothetical protein